MSAGRWSFDGRIAGVGTASGVRVVVGQWRDTHLGSFSDAMVETASGERVLLAPGEEVAEFVAATYTFDEVRIEPFEVSATDGVWQVRSPSLDLDLTVGGVTAVGRLLRLVPRGVATAQWWCSVIDPIARAAMRGVRTRGSAGAGRREWYGATDNLAVTALRGTYDGVDLGALAPVDPAPRFGFSSTPRKPSVTAVTTTIEPAARPR